MNEDYLQEIDYLKSRIDSMTKDYEGLNLAYKTIKKAHEEEFQKYFAKNLSLENENKSLKKKLFNSTILFAENILMLKNKLEEKSFEDDYGVPF
jgi:hypothetical protein